MGRSAHPGARAATTGTPAHGASDRMTEQEDRDASDVQTMGARTVATRLPRGIRLAAYSFFIGFILGALVTFLTSVVVRRLDRD